MLCIKRPQAFDSPLECVLAKPYVTVQSMLGRSERRANSWSSAVSVSYQRSKPSNDSVRKLYETDPHQLSVYHGNKAISLCTSPVLLKCIEYVLSCENLRSPKAQFADVVLNDFVVLTFIKSSSTSELSRHTVAVIWKVKY